MMQYWLKYERISTTKGRVQGRKQRPRDFCHRLLGSAGGIFGQARPRGVVQS